MSLAVDEMLLKYKDIHERLMHPAHPIYDRGINLHPDRLPRERVIEYHKPPVETEVKVTPQLTIKVSVKEIIRRAQRLNLQISPIIHIVKDIYHIPIKELKGRDRTKEKVIPRHLIFFLLRKHTNLSFSSIGHLFFRDHTTIIHGINHIKGLIVKGDQIAETIVFIENTLGLEHNPKPKEPEKPVNIEPLDGLQGLA